MKDLVIKNHAEINGITAERDGNKFYIKPVIADKDIDTCEAAFIEVPAGNYAFAYHYHDAKEEIFYIVSGKGKLRTYQGERDVKAGDMLCFPTGEKGSHVLANASPKDSLVFIDFGVKTYTTDIVTFPDFEKVMLVGNHFSGEIIDAPKKITC